MPDFMIDKVIETQKDMLDRFMERSYKIGRNDPCPCGSGKKYKKCCDRIRPEKGLEEHLEIILDEDNQARRRSLLETALKDHPLEPVLLSLSSIDKLMAGNPEGLKEELHTLWKLVQMDMDISYIYLLTGMLMDEGEFEKAGLILKKVENKMGDAVVEIPDLIMNYSRYYLHIGNYPKGLDYLQRANDKYPDNDFVRDLTLRFLINEGMIDKAFEYWYERFDDFDYRNPDDLVEYMVKTLAKNFNEDINYTEREIKELLNIYLDVLEVKRKCDIFINQDRIKDAIKLVDRLVEKVPKDSLLFLELLTEYGNLEAWDSLLSISEEFEGEIEDSFYNFLLAKAYYYTGKYDKALGAIEKVFKQSRGNEKTERLEEDIKGVYLLILAALKKDKTLISFLQELDEENAILSEDSNIEYTFIDDLEDILKNYPLREVFRVFIYLQELDIDLFSDEDLYIFMLAQIYHSLELDDEEVIKQVFIDTEEWRKRQSLTRSIIADFIDLLLRKDELEQAEFEEKLYDFINRKAANRQEADIKYDMILLYGDPEIIIKEKPEEDILPKALLKHYHLIASIKNGSINEFEEESGRLLMYLLHNTDRYLSEEESMNVLQKMGITDKFDYQQVEKEIKEDVDSFLEEKYKEIAEN